MKKLLIATHNKGKVGEYKNFLKDLPVELVSLTDLGITEDVQETGSSYEENSTQKARYYARVSKLPAVADDGGIEISALGNQPGLKSKRWLGEGKSEQDLIDQMMKVAKMLPDNNRRADFIAVATLALPTGEHWSFEGRIRGEIEKKPLLKHLEGYPYRSFFFIPEIRKYYHEDELTDEEQKLYNHRYKAVQKLKPVIIEKLSLP